MLKYILNLFFFVVRLNFHKTDILRAYVRFYGISGVIVKSTIFFII